MNESNDLVVFSMPGNEDFARSLARLLNADTGEAEIREFPDGETYLRVFSRVEGRPAVIVSTLFHPNARFVPLYFLTRHLRSLGATQICLAAPYLAYMRQDKAFEAGEAVTSEYFADLISSFADSIITVDPHLHRRDSLSEIFSIPNETVHAADHISEWVKKNVDWPLLIGPDIESEQWVAEVARRADAPFTVLQKIRHGDREVEVSTPQLEEYRGHTPVLVDDIISTARTMIETVKQLKRSEMKAPICVGVHGVFADDSYSQLLAAGVAEIVTCNTIPHVSNRIDVSDLFVGFIERLRQNS